MVVNGRCCIASRRRPASALLIYSSKRNSSDANGLEEEVRCRDIDMLMCEQAKSFNASRLRGEPINTGAVHFIWRVER